MFKSAPHVLPYQGSKRKLAGKIIEYIPSDIHCLYEPFAGSAALTLAVAANGMAKKFIIGDKLEPLADFWSMVVHQPYQLAEEYADIWRAQLSDPAGYYLEMRAKYNREKSPVTLLYLIARCVKNAVRFNSAGEFNQGADNRRLGLRPEKFAKEVQRASVLLKNRAEIYGRDFREVLHSVRKTDLVYLDPPWQGTSGKRDPRYAYLLEIDELLTELDSLNRREIPFILSFDGACGDKKYGDELPKELGMTRVALWAGRSSQATLLGRNEETIESLYLSPSLFSKRPLNLVQKKLAPLQVDMVI